MGIATACNWIWNFLISFFTPYITGAIDYQYGYVFAACCFMGAVVVYFFVDESQGRTLEEIDSMYVSGVPAWKSSSWKPPAYEDSGDARGIRQRKTTSAAGDDVKESFAHESY